MNKYESLHEINRYLDSVTKILEFIKEDAIIHEEDTRKMLDLAISKKDEIIQIANNLSKEIGEGR